MKHERANLCRERFVHCLNTVQWRGMIYPGFCFLLNVQTVGFHQSCGCVVLLKAELIMMKSNCEQASSRLRNPALPSVELLEEPLSFLHAFTLLEHFRDKFWLLQQQQQDPEWLVETSHGPVTVLKVYRRVSKPQIFSDMFMQYELLPRKGQFTTFSKYSIYYLKKN